MSDDKEIYERLTRLEVIAKEQAKLEEGRSRKLDIIEGKQDEIIGELSKYRGWVGGVLFILSAIGIFFKMFGEVITGWFSP